MTRFLVQRILWSALVLITVVTLVFILIFVAGDPAATTLGERASKDQIDDFKRQKGLDQPVWKQYLSYWGVWPCVRTESAQRENGQGPKFCGLLQGELGQSYSHHESVSNVIGHRLPRTILLGIMTLIFELFIGIGAGIYAAMRRNTWTDTSIMAFTFLGISLPTYVTGPLVLFTFAFLLGWFPVGGYGVDFWDHVYHGVLPSMVLAIAGAATYARIMRGEMIETLRKDHIRTAHAKGLPPAQVMLKHGVRNALIPIVTMIGLSLPFLVGGAIITEKIFAWPGLGMLTIEAINTLDAPVIMAVVVMFGVAVQVGNLLADIAVALLDPRVRL